MLRHNLWVLYIVTPSYNVMHSRNFKTTQGITQMTHVPVD
jgi:hypothetical protein